MEPKNQNFFKAFVEIEPSPILLSKILSNIYQDKVRQKRKIVFLSGFTLVTASSGLILAANYTAKQLVSSGFFDYASLLFTDKEILTNYLVDFSSLLLESLPIFGLIISLISAVALLLALKVIINSLRPGMSQIQLSK